MTAPHTRSMNAEMLHGMVEGSYKEVVKNRTDHPDHRLQWADRTLLNAGGNGYGIFEAPVMRTQDGRFVRDKGREAPGVAEG